MGSIQSTPHFTVNGTMVTGFGASSVGHDDSFYGQRGVNYNVTIAGGANLFSQNNNGASYNPDGGSPASEVIYMYGGNFVNNGTLNTYPSQINDTAHNYKKTAVVVYINNTAANPSVITNNGSIGDFPGISSKSNPFYSYQQEDSAGIFLQGNGTITNNSGATISGYNAVFTKGSGTLNNYGTILGDNDGALTGFTINNYAGASMSNGVAGFACVHAYNNLNNYGYMLGQDYGILAEGRSTIINDYGGAAVPGVSNFNGSQVYNGEVSALLRGPETPNVNGPFMTGDAIMMDTSGSQVNLISTTSNGVVYFPVILGPMEGGFNGNFDSSSAHVLNTLNFDFQGLTTAQVQSLQAAIFNSAHSNANGTYYSGSVVLNGNTYQWEDFANVEYQGAAVTAVPTLAAKPSPTATKKATTTPTATKSATTTSAISARSLHSTSGNHSSSGPGLLDIGLLLIGLLCLLVLAFALYRYLRKRMQARQASLTQDTSVSEQNTQDMPPYHNDVSKQTTLINEPEAWHVAPFQDRPVTQNLGQPSTTQKVPSALPSRRSGGLKLSDFSHEDHS